jgi:hypothetical protein
MITAKMANISQIKRIKISTFATPGKDSKTAVTMTFKFLFLLMNLSGLKVLSNRKSLTNDKFAFVSDKSIRDEQTMMKSNLHQLSLKYEPFSKTSPRAIILVTISAVKKIVIAISKFVEMVKWVA